MTVRRLLAAGLVGLCLGGPAWGQPAGEREPAPVAARSDAPAIRLPDVAPPVPPQPPPPPPGSVTKLVADTLYVVDADVAVLVFGSPPGLLRITPEAGPLRIRGRFVDGSGVETRTYKGKYVVTVEAAGKGRAELFVLPAGVTAETDIIRRVLDVDGGQGPRPPPDPDPQPEPEPDPGPTPAPAPIPGPGLKVLIVEETADRTALPAGQQDIILGRQMRDYLNAKTAAETLPDGRTWKAWRIYDKDMDVSADLPHWQAALARPRTSLPWLVVSNGTTGYEGPLPADADKATALIEKYVPKQGGRRGDK